MKHGNYTTVYQPLLKLGSSCSLLVSGYLWGHIFSFIGELRFALIFGTADWALKNTLYRKPRLSLKLKKLCYLTVVDVTHVTLSYCDVIGYRNG